MCEILFRGKRKNTGEWVYGDLVRLKDGGKSIPHIYGYGEVIPETVGQYTGLTDKNGKRIFEGDIVFTEHGSIHEEDGNAVIEWDEDTARFVVKWDGLICDFDNFYGHDLEVIGNIHDNPELLNQSFT